MKSTGECLFPFFFLPSFFSFFFYLLLTLFFHSSYYSLPFSFSFSMSFSFPLSRSKFLLFATNFISTEELSYYLFTRNLVLNSIGSDSRGSKVDMNPIQVPLSKAVDVTCQILKNTSPKHQMELLFRLDQSSLPERTMDTQLKLNMSNILNRSKSFAGGRDGGANRAATGASGSGGGGASSSATYQKFFQKEMIVEEPTEKARNEERRALMQLKERLLSWSPHVQTNSGEREIDLERFLYLACRSFRSAQRKFKRELKRSLYKENEDGIKRRHATESEFVESLMSIEQQWTPDQARAIFHQGQEQLAAQHAKEGFTSTR